MKYCSVVATSRGGPECLQVVENDLRAPASAEARLRVLAAPVCMPDVQSRRGLSPFPPKIPFTPGYAAIGVVDALGSGVAAGGPVLGDRMAALTIYGSYAEYVYIPAKQLIPLPHALDPVEAAPLILNYLVAYQSLHRSARVRAGQTALIIGASGGIGTAFLQLGRLAGLRMYALASQSKHAVLVEYGAAPIDYRTQDFVEVIRQTEPAGLDVVFDGMGGESYAHGYACLKPGGVIVGYGNPLSFSNLVGLLWRTASLNLRRDGRTAKLYGTGAMFIHRAPFIQDWAALFKLLEARLIQPVIAQKFPLLEAAKANALLESGSIVGNIVLCAPHLL